MAIDRDLPNETAVPLEGTWAREAQAQGIDIPSALEDLVRSRPDDAARRDEEREAVRRSLLAYASYAEEHGAFSDEWRRF